MPVLFGERPETMRLRYEEIEKNLGKMYDTIVGIDVLDNWDEITSVVNR